MPNGFPTGLKNYMKGNNLQLAVGVRLARKDGLILGLCSHSQSVRLASGTPGICPVPAFGLTLHSSPGMSARPTIASSDLSVDNSAFDGWVTPDILSEEELRRGLWDDAEALIFVFCYSNISLGTGFLGAGRLGKARLKGDGLFEIAIRSLEDLLQSQVGQRTSVTCRNRGLGTGTCPVNTALETAQVGGKYITRTGTVSTVADSPFNRRRFNYNSSGEPDGFYANGKVAFVSGQNNGLTIEVRSSSGSTVELWEDLPYPISSGDMMQMTMGCDLSWNMCTTTFKDFGAPARFNGEPYIPGEDVYAVNRGQQ